MSIMIEALKNGGIVDEARIAEAHERNAQRDRLLKAAMKECEAAGCIFDAAKIKKESRERDLADVIQRAEKFISQGHRVEYWRNVVTTHVRRDNEAETELCRARARCEQAIERLQVFE